jgi:hypothetical protein
MPESWKRKRRRDSSNRSNAACFQKGVIRKVTHPDDDLGQADWIALTPRRDGELPLALWRARIPPLVGVYPTPGGRSGSLISAPRRHFSALALTNKTNESKFCGGYADAPRHVIMGAGRIYMTLNLAHCLHRDGDHTGGHERRDSGASEVVKNRMPRTRKDTPVR